jgi:hypothetical protein
MLISTILGRFVIPVYYVLGERIRDRGSRPSSLEEELTAKDAKTGERRGSLRR